MQNGIQPFHRIKKLYDKPMKKLDKFKWNYYPDFSSFEPDELYEVLKLRQDIFIIEQACPYDDMDGLDQDSEHLMLYDDQTLVGYLRLVPAGLKFETVSIGRVVIAESYRGKGFGKMLMEKAFSILKDSNRLRVTIEAQEHQERFYSSFGFKTISKPYDIDGISHIKMVTDLLN